MRKLLPLVSICILFVFYGCKKQNSFDERCQKEAQELTHRKCPQTVTEGIICDSITYDLKTHTMQYHYTMSGEYDNPETIAKGLADFKKALGNSITNSIDLKKYKDNGISFRYTYLSKSTKKVLIDETFTKKDYTR